MTQALEEYPISGILFGEDPEIAALRFFFRCRNRVRTVIRPMARWWDRYGSELPEHPLEGIIDPVETVHQQQLLAHVRTYVVELGPPSVLQLADALRDDPQRALQDHAGLRHATWHRAVSTLLFLVELLVLQELRREVHQHVDAEDNRVLQAWARGSLSLDAVARETRKDRQTVVEAVARILEIARCPDLKKRSRP